MGGVVSTPAASTSAIARLSTTTVTLSALPVTITLPASTVTAPGITLSASTIITTAPAITITASASSCTLLSAFTGTSSAALQSSFATNSLSSFSTYSSPTTLQTIGSSNNQASSLLATSAISTPTAAASSISGVGKAVNATQTSIAVAATVATGSGRSLTLLELGDSITYGTQNEAAGGYRLSLLNLLTGTTPLSSAVQANVPTALYQTVNTIGSVQSGNFTQNSCEAWPSLAIDEIQAKFLANSPQYAQAPDVVLLHAGTCDIVYNYTSGLLHPKDIATAPARLGIFLDAIFHQYPRTTILVAELIEMAIPAEDALKVAFNSAVLGMVQLRALLGQRVVPIAMNEALTLPSDLIDWVHPSQAGYQKMATAWYNGVVSARSAGFLA